MKIPSAMRLGVVIGVLWPAAGAVSRALSGEPPLQLTGIRAEGLPSPAPNLVTNFSFEATTPHGQPDGWNWDPRNTDATLAVDDATAHAGHRSVRIANATPFGPHVYGTLWMAESLHLQPGTKYTLSFYAKSVAPGTAWVGGGNQWRVRIYLTGTGDAWQRFATTFTAVDEERDFRLQINTDSPTPGFWIDDVKLEEGEHATFCIPPDTTAAATLAAALPRDYGDGPWQSEFEVYSARPRAHVRALVSLASLGGPVVHRAELDLSAGLTRLIVSGAAQQASPDPVTLSLTLEDAAGEQVAEGQTRLAFLSEEFAKTRLAAVRQRVARLQQLIAQWRQRTLDPAYPLVGVTVLENFVDYVAEDLSHGEIRRAFDQLAALEEIGERTEQLLRAVLDGQPSPPVVPRYVTGPNRIVGPSFLAQTATSETASRCERPVFFTGYGHFGQVCRDLEKFHDYGANIIQIELGPHSVFVGPQETNDEPLRNLQAVLDRAARSNVAVTLLISPHYMPAWMLEKYPHLRKKREGFLQYCLHAPEGQEFLQHFVQWLIPAIKDHPALHSICLSNEPVNVEEPCEPGRLAWQEWLRVRHGNIGILNHRWHTEYADFQHVPLPDPFARATRPPRQLEYDFVLFNQEFFAGWHRQLADAIHAIAPRMPVHAKAMTWTFLSDGDLRCGVDAELFGQFSQINGNDSVNFYEREGGEWAESWQLNAMSHDLQRSVRDLPIFNTENHVIADREKRAIPPQHIRSALWQAAVHGQSATTVWVWERTFDSQSDFAGSIMHRPACAEAVGRTGLDLLRLAEEVTALQTRPPQVAVLFSTTSLFYDGGDYTDLLGQVYRALAFSGLKIGFVTERQLATGQIPSAPVLFVPGIRHLPRAASEALYRYGGKVVAVGGDDVLSRDEWDEPAAKVRQADGRIACRRGSQDAQQLWRDVLEQLRAWSVTPEIAIRDIDGRPVWGVEWLTAAMGGRRVVNLINFRRDPVTVVLTDNERPCIGDNLFNGATMTNTIVVPSLEPLLLSVNNP
jgi:hypothetical protein